MFRQLAFRQASILRAARPVHPARALTCSVAARKSIVDSAKEVLEKVNKKTGEALASTIETTENVAPTTENVKQAAETVNKKTGEILADGIEKAEEATSFAKDKASNITEDVKDKASDLKEDAKIKAADLKEDAKDKAADLKDEAAAKKKVVENTAGYKNLQDKGSKIESEQNRPDDAV